jgi:hypothetical protein
MLKMKLFDILRRFGIYRKKKRFIADLSVDKFSDKSLEIRNGNGSSMYYFDNLSVNENKAISLEKTQNSDKFKTEITYNDFKSYVRKNQNEGIFDKTIKEIMYDLNVKSQSKIQRFKAKAIDEKYLISTTKQSIYRVNE